ncbi:MAG: hypothetical protein AAFV77_12125, partial [Planctomycetota bacterium]
MVEPDPGSRRAARLAWLAFAVMLPIVVIFQQMSAHSSTTEPETAAITAPQGDEVEVAARLGARAAFSLGQGGGTFQSSVDESAGGSTLQEFRAAISAGELVSHANAARRLGDVIADLENAEPTDDTDAADQRAQLLADARLLEDYYRALDDDPDAAERLGDDALNGLVERHGFFGELVRIAPLPQDHELRTQMLDGALMPLFIMLIVLVVMGLAILAGLGLGITALVMVASGSIRMAMPRPKPGGSVYLESAVLFVACFAFLQIAQQLAALMGEQALATRGTRSHPAWALASP